MKKQEVASKNGRIGWIDVKQETPPLNMEVVILYSNCAYGGHCSNTLGKRIGDDVYALGGNGMELNSNEKVLGSYVTHWAYHFNGQKLPNICQCFACRPELEENMINGRLNQAREYALSQGCVDGDGFVKWIKRNCGYKFDILFLSHRCTGGELDETPTNERLYELYESKNGRF